MTKLGRNQPCHCGSGRKYKKCCLGLDYARGQPSSPDPDASMTLIIETPAGPAMRRIPPALPPRLASDYGKAVEDAAQGAAMIWGMPDFVFRPQIRQVGTGSRELGDGVLTTGDLALVLQVKTRERPTPHPGREESWVRKVTAKAFRQAKGTVRQLCAEPAEMVNARGRTLPIRGAEYEWFSVVILDHPALPSDLELQVPASGIALARQDWDFLFDQLKSTHAVAQYLKRVVGNPVKLGREAVRYYQLALADADTEPSQLDRRFVLLGSETFSAPQLPLAPAAVDDADAHRLFRSILEDIAMTHLTSATEERRVRVLAELDRLPVAQRANIGNYLLDGFEDVLGCEDGVLWHLRRVTGGLENSQLAFGVCSQFDPDIQSAFRAWVELRHWELSKRIGPGSEELVTAGVLLTPRLDGLRPWDTTMCAVAGDLGLTPESLSDYIEVWGAETDVVAGGPPARRV